jgi:hypothetical protein
MARSSQSVTEPDEGKADDESADAQKEIKHVVHGGPSSERNPLDIGLSV